MPGCRQSKSIERRPAEPKQAFPAEWNRTSEFSQIPAQIPCENGQRRYAKARRRADTQTWSQVRQGLVQAELAGRSAALLAHARAEAGGARRQVDEAIAEADARTRQLRHRAAERRMPSTTDEVESGVIRLIIEYAKVAIWEWTRRRSETILRNKPLSSATIASFSASPA